MSFLSNLFEREAKRAVTDVVDHAVGQAIRKGFNQLEDSIGEHIRESSPSGTCSSGNTNPSVDYRAPHSTDQTSSRVSGEAGLRTRLEQVIAAEWSGYELRRDVSAAELNAPAGARDYSYVLYLSGQPKAGFMVLTNRNHYMKKDVRLAHEGCRALGIPCMNFMSHLPNETSYISQRLKKNIQ